MYFFVFIRLTRIKIVTTKPTLFTLLSCVPRTVSHTNYSVRLHIYGEISGFACSRRFNWKVFLSTRFLWKKKYKKHVNRFAIYFAAELRCSDDGLECVRVNNNDNNNNAYVQGVFIERQMIIHVKMFLFTISM